MGMEDFRFLLGDLATAFREDAIWNRTIVPGRFRIDPFEAPLGGHEPGLGETQIWFYCDRAIVTTPWPVLGDQLIIRKQLYEIVQLDEDDIGEFGFRLIRQEIGISTVTSEGAISGQPIVNPLERRPAFAEPTPNYANPMQPMPAAGIAAAKLANGRPSRRAEIVQAFNAAVADGTIDPARPLKELCAVMHHRMGNGGGLSNRTLRRVVGALVRSRRVGD